MEEVCAAWVLINIIEQIEKKEMNPPGHEGLRISPAVSGFLLVTRSLERIRLWMSVSGRWLTNDNHK